mgnify:CR=1 FL=1
MTFQIGSKRIGWTGSTSSSGGSGSLTPTNITHAALQLLYLAGTMTPGFYKITDKADAGIILEAITSSRLSLNGTGLFLNPDFQSQGNYSGVVGLTGVAYTTTLGVWAAAAEPGYANGRVVFYGGFHYQVVNTASFDGNSPDPGVNGYDLLPMAEANMGYILDADYVEYDLINDVILLRADSRGNRIKSENLFQWGNNAVRKNIAIGEMYNVNSLAAACIGNFVGADIRFNTNGLEPTQKINYNTLNCISSSAYGELPPLTIDANNLVTEMVGCIINTDKSINFEFTTKDPTFGVLTSRDTSTFSESMTITGLTTIDLGDFKNYVGELNVSSGNATESIDLFANFQTGVPVRINPQVGLTVTFVHGMGANEPRCNGGINKIINGSNGDTIQFVKREDGFIYQANGNTF